MVLCNFDTRMYEQNIKQREQQLKTYIWYPPAILGERRFVLCCCRTVSVIFPSQVTRFHIMKLRVTIGNYRHTLASLSKPRYFPFKLATAEPNILIHGFSKYGTRTPPGTPHTLFTGTRL